LDFPKPAPSTFNRGDFIMSITSTSAVAVVESKPVKLTGKPKQTAKKAATKAAKAKGKKPRAKPLTDTNRITLIGDVLKPFFDAIAASDRDVDLGIELLKQVEKHQPKMVLTATRNKKFQVVELTDKVEKFVNKLIDKLAIRFGKRRSDILFYINAANAFYNFGAIVRQISVKQLRALFQLQQGNILVKIPRKGVDFDKIGLMFLNVKSGKYGGTYGAVADAVRELIGKAKKAPKSPPKHKTVRLPRALQAVVEAVDRFSKDRSTEANDYDGDAYNDIALSFLNAIKAPMDAIKGRIAEKPNR